MAEKRYAVAAAQIVVKVPGATGGEAYLRRGRLLPNTVEKAEIKRLLALDLIAEAEEVESTLVVDAPPAPPAGSTPPASSDSVEVPAGAPAKGWTHAQIDAWAGAQTPVVVLDKDASIQQKLDAIAAVNKS